jgi:hypothetical protein
MGRAKIFGEFFTNASGHPGCERDIPIIVKTIGKDSSVLSSVTGLDEFSPFVQLSTT